jgi:hypothetical protein
VIDSAFASVSDMTAVARAYLATEEGRRLRHRVATALIVGAPLISELPLVRRSWAARILRTAAVGTLLIRGAEWIRDWDPSLAADPGTT